MPAIQVRNVPADLHETLRHRAAEARVSLSAYVLDLLEREAAKPTTQEWLDSLTGREPVPGIDVNATLDRVRRDQRVVPNRHDASGLRS